MSESHGFKAPRWAWRVATGFGSGRLRSAPGTWGSLAGLLVWLLLAAVPALPLNAWARRHGHGPSFWLAHAGMELFFIALPVAMAWLAVKASDLVVAETGEKDPGYIVADEWAGIFVALWPMRMSLMDNAYPVWLSGSWRGVALLAVPFLAFRLFDILKPWPCEQLQDLPGGQGVVADDVVAGLYAIPLTLLLAPLLLAR